MAKHPRAGARPFLKKVPVTPTVARFFSHDQSILAPFLAEFLDNFGK